MARGWFGFKHLPVPATHWRRVNRNDVGGFAPVVPIEIFSRRVAELRHCIATASNNNDDDSSNTLFLLNGLEQSILPLIASYCGLAVISPCSCCKGQPFRFCEEQSKLLPVGPVTTEESYPEEMVLPLKLYQEVQKEDALYHSEGIRFSRGETDDWHWTAETVKILPPMPSTAGAVCSGGGLGYLVLTSKGLYSDSMDVEWASLDGYQITCRRDRVRNVSYEYRLRISKTIIGKPYKRAEMKVKYEYSKDGTRKEIPLERPIDMMAYDISSKSATFKFSSLKEFKRVMTVVLAKRKKSAVEIVPLRGSCYKSSGFILKSTNPSEKSGVPGFFRCDINIF